MERKPLADFRRTLQWNEKPVSEWTDADKAAARAYYSKRSDHASHLIVELLGGAVRPLSSVVK